MSRRVEGLRILAPGPLATVQDLGRYGHQHLGFAPGGPADVRAHILANALVGNPPEAPTIEVTLGGFRARAEGDLTLAVVAADGAAVRIAGAAAEPNRTLPLRAGEELAVARSGGARAYLAVRGAFDLPARLGSVATDLSAGIGGTTGGPLRAGEFLTLPDERGRESGPLLEVPREWVPRAERRIVAPCSPGPQYGLFSGDDADLFGRMEYTVTPQADRVGVRLAGPALRSGPGQILSEGQPEGAVQIPPEGQPIVLLQGRRTIGGYPKIAVLGMEGLWAFAQVLPGAAVRFAWCSAQEAGQRDRQLLGALAEPGKLLRAVRQS